MRPRTAARLILAAVIMVIACAFCYAQGYLEASTGPEAPEIWQQGFREGYTQGQAWGYTQGYERAIIDAGEALNNKE